MKKTIFVIMIIPVILFSSCSGSKFFYRPNKQMKETTLENAIITKLFIPNEIQKKIALTHIVPANEIKNNITILIIPPNGGNSSILAELMQPLVNAGYALYLFDYEGYGKSEGKENNTNVLKDAQCVLEYVINHKTNNEKLLLWGYSLGGNLAVKLTLNNQNQISALIIEAAFTSHQDIAKAIAPKSLKWVAKLIRSPYPSKKLIQEIHVPVFIAHSVNDKVCPFNMGETLYQNANPPKFFLQLSGEHCYGLLQETDKYIDNLEFFLMHNNIK
jgi:pimeloyl-ACP methyl ester carboxylesterase